MTLMAQMVCILFSHSHSSNADRRLPGFQVQNLLSIYSVLVFYPPLFSFVHAPSGSVVEYSGGSDLKVGGLFFFLVGSFWNRLGFFSECIINDVSLDSARGKYNGGTRSRVFFS